MIRKILMVSALALSTLGVYSAQGQNYPRRSEPYIMPRSTHVYMVPRHSPPIYAVPRRTTYELRRRTSPRYYRHYRRHHRYYRHGYYYR